MRKFFVSLLVIALAVSVMFNFGLLAAYRSYLQTDPEIEEKWHSGSQTATDKIAIITIKGLIADSDGFVKRQIDRVAKESKEHGNIKAVVLRIDSPGGLVTASDNLYNALKKLRQETNLPLVVSMGSLAASGGYYVAMAADGNDTIFAEPATWTGSIGVLVPHFDISEFLARYKITDDSVASEPLKQMLSATKEKDDDLKTREHAVIKGLVDESFERFKEIVRQSRPMLKANPDLMAKATTGQIFSASQAKALGLIDQIGYLDKAVERAATMANVQVEDVRVVQYKEPKNFLSAALGASSESQSQLAMLLDLTAPRAYYLFTSLPAALGTRK